MTDRALHEIGRRGHSEQPHDLGLVILGRTYGDIQATRDFFRGVTFCEQLQHFALPGCKQSFVTAVLGLGSERPRYGVRQRRSKVGASCECFADGGQQLRAGGLFQDVCGRPCPDGTNGIQGVAVHGWRDAGGHVVKQDAVVEHLLAVVQELVAIMPQPRGALHPAERTQGDPPASDEQKQNHQRHGRRQRREGLGLGAGLGQQNLLAIVQMSDE